MEEGTDNKVVGGGNKAEEAALLFVRRPSGFSLDLKEGRNKNRRRRRKRSQKRKRRKKRRKKKYAPKCGTADVSTASSKPISERTRNPKRLRAL